MDVVEYLKEKEQILSAKFENTFGPQIRHLSGKISDSFESFTQTMPWLSKLNGFFEADNELSKVSSPKVLEFYNKWAPKIDEETFVGEWHNVDQQHIDDFAEVTGDRQWIHIDQARAASESPFGTTIAHGFLVLSLLPKLTEAVDPEKPVYPEARMVVNYGLNSVRFPYPVKNGSRVRARTTLRSLTAARKSITLVNEIKVEIEGSKRTACVVEAVLKLYF